MGQRNTPHNSHMIDFEADQQGQNHILPDPCVFYGNLPPFPQPNVHTAVPVSGNAGNTYLHPLPEQHENPLFYGMTHYNGTIHQRPATNLDLAMATSSNHYNPYVAAPSATREFPIPVIHGTHDHLPFPTAQGMVGIHTDGYGRNIPYADGLRGLFKRKNAEGIPMNFQYHHAMVGSSSAVAPVIARVHEADASLVDVASRVPPDYGDSSLLTEDVSQRSLRNRSGVSGQESVAAHSNNHFIQGSYVGQAFPLPGNPWLDMQLNGNQATLLPYVHGSMGGCVEAGNMGIQGYQGTASNGSLTSFMRPPIPQGFSSVHHLPPSIQGMGGHNMNFPPQMASSSHRVITNGPSSSSISPFPGVVDAGPRYMGPFPPTGFRFYRPHRRDILVETNITRNRNIPNMRVLPEDGVAILEIPDYNEVGDSIDQHRDMRMDIDHMSYEELLALGEQIGAVTTGLSEEVIISLLKTRSFTSSATSSNPCSAECLDQETDFCVICQNDYKDQEKVGTVECGHEYHVDCIKKWLVVKNTCPICKSTALSPRKTEL